MEASNFFIHQRTENENGSMIEQTMQDGSSIFSIEKLLSFLVDANKKDFWNYNCPQAFQKLEKICRNGIPLYIKVQFWQILGKQEILKKISSDSLIKFNKMRNYYQGRIDDMELEQDQDYSAYERFLKGASENFLIQFQEIHDNINYLQKEVLYKKESGYLKSYENIIFSYIHWSLHIGQEMHYFNYSWHLIVICDRLWVLLDSQQPEDCSL